MIIVILSSSCDFTHSVNTVPATQRDNLSNVILSVWGSGFAKFIMSGCLFLLKRAYWFSLSQKVCCPTSIKESPSNPKFWFKSQTKHRVCVHMHRLKERSSSSVAVAVCISAVDQNSKQCHTWLAVHQNIQL